MSIVSWLFANDEISELALEWLELLLSEGMGTRNCQRFEGISPASEIGRINATSHPYLINCMNEPTETPDELYHNFIAKIGYGLTVRK